MAITLQTMVFLVSLFSLWAAIRFYNHSKLLANIPGAKIRSAAQGYVEIIGRARPILPVAIHAPLSNHPCVWYEYRFNSGKNDKFFRTSGSFLIDDGSATCLIEPNYMRVESRFSATATEWLDGYRGTLASRWIKVGEKIHVYGQLVSLDHTVQRSNKDLIRERITALKKDQVRMQQADHNGDGQIDRAEWDTVRTQIEKEVERTLLDMQQQQKELPRVTHVLRKPEDKRMPFLISSFAELNTIQRFRWYAAGWFLLFLIAGSSVLNSAFWQAVERLF